MRVTVPRRRFTVEEYHRIAAAGVLGPDERLELLEGEILESAGTGDRHATCIRRFRHVLELGLRGRALVRVQSPLRLGAFSEAIPDVVVVRTRPDGYADGPPNAEDVLLIIEVGEKASRFDDLVKGPVYARAGIPEYWMVDVDTRCIEIRLGPCPEGYQDLDFAARGQRARPTAFRDVGIWADEIID